MASPADKTLHSHQDDSEETKREKKVHKGSLVICTAHNSMCGRCTGMQSNTATLSGKVFPL